MYQFEFIFTEESYLAFNWNYANHSKTIRQMQQLLRVICPIFIFIAGYYITDYKDLWGVFVFGTVALLWFILYPRFYKRRTVKLIDKLLKEGKVVSIGKWHQVTFDKDQITEVCEELGSMKSWTKLYQIDQDEAYVFLYISSMEALVVPKAVIGEALKGFLDFCEQNLLTK